MKRVKKPPVKKPPTRPVTRPPKIMYAGGKPGKMVITVGNGGMGGHSGHKM